MSDWREITLRDVGRIVTGKTPPTSDAGSYGGDIPFVTPSDMDGKRVIEKTARTLTSLGASKVRSCLVQKPSVVVSCIGSDMGKAALVAGPFVSNQQINSITVADQFDRLFVYYNLSARKDEIRNKASGAAQPIMNKSDFGNLKISVPELSVQKAIGSALSALDDKIELNRRMNETLEAMAQAIFKDWFVDFGPVRRKLSGVTDPAAIMGGLTPARAAELAALFPDGFGEDGLPEGWSVGSLGDFTSLQNGYAFKSSDWQESGVPVVKIGSVKPAVVDMQQVSFVTDELAGQKNEFRLNVGDTLVGLTGYVGETGRIPPTLNLPLLNQRVARFHTNGNFSPFVYCCVRNEVFKNYAESKSHGSAQANVSTRDLLRYEVVNSSEALLSEFNIIAGMLLSKSLSGLGENQTLAETRDYLLPKLMSGEVRVSDAEKMVG
jgi:type I restriction enzyme, S subunit